jgi:hypothetical protein
MLRIAKNCSVRNPIGDLWFLVAEFARHGCAGSADKENPTAADQRDIEFVM